MSDQVEIVVSFGGEFSEPVTEHKKSMQSWIYFET